MRLSSEVIQGVFFLTGSAPKVLSVGDGKIPTKKVKVRECHRKKCEVLTQTFTFLVGILPLIPPIDNF